MDSEMVKLDVQSDASMKETLAEDGEILFSSHLNLCESSNEFENVEREIIPSNTNAGSNNDDKLSRPCSDPSSIYSGIIDPSLFQSYLKTRKLNVIKITEGMRKKKPTKLKMNEDSEISFILNMLYYEGTVLSNIWPQLCIVWMMVLLANTIYFVRGEPEHLIPPDASTMFTTVGTALAFLVAFRVNQSQDSYVEGRKIMGMISNSLREIVQASSTYGLKDHSLEEMEKIMAYQSQICRLVNLQYAVIRHQLREFNGGFDPDSDLNLPESPWWSLCADSHSSKEIQDNFKRKWALDPVEPLISDLMNEEEFNMLENTEPPIRPVMIQKRLLLTIHDLAQHIEHSGFFLMQVTRKLEDCIDYYKGALRIIETPIPVPYRHFLYIVTFLFVYISPWIYVPQGHGYIFQSSWLVSTAICVTYYGMMELAAALQDPFGWDGVDLDLDAMGMKIFKETKHLAEIVANR